MDARTVIRVLKTPVTLILLVVFVVWVTQWALAEVRKPIPKAPLPPCVVTDVGPELTTDKVFVRVYNGTETSGLARRLASTLRADPRISNFCADRTRVQIFMTFRARESPQKCSR